MPLSALTSPELPPAAGAYSHIVEANGVVYTAGCGPQDPETGLVTEGIAAQTAQMITNLEHALAVVGLGLSDVAKTTVHLQDIQRDFAAYDDVYQARFTRPCPVRTTVGSTLIDILVEIDAVAVLSGRDRANETRIARPSRP